MSLLSKPEAINKATSYQLKDLEDTLKKFKSVTSFTSMLIDSYILVH